MKARSGGVPAASPGSRHSSLTACLARSPQFGFKTENNLVGQEFAWLGSIFYFGYLFSIERIRANKTGISAHGIKCTQVTEALRDPRFYLCSFAVFSASVPNGGISSFGATIVQGFGFTTKQTTLLGMSTGGSEAVAMFIGVMLSRWTKMRGIPASICIAVSVCGAAMMVGIPLAERNARYAG